jgi:hypothetical protein
MTNIMFHQDAACLQQPGLLHVWPSWGGALVQWGVCVMQTLVLLLIACLMASSALLLHLGVWDITR